MRECRLARRYRRSRLHYRRMALNARRRRSLKSSSPPQAIRQSPAAAPDASMPRPAAAEFLLLQPSADGHAHHRVRPQLSMRCPAGNYTITTAPEVGTRDGHLPPHGSSPHTFISMLRGTKHLTLERMAAPMKRQRDAYFDDFIPPPYAHSPAGRAGRHAPF